MPSQLERATVLRVNCSARRERALLADDSMQHCRGDGCVVCGHENIDRLGMTVPDRSREETKNCLWKHCCGLGSRTGMRLWFRALGARCVKVLSSGGTGFETGSSEQGTGTDRTQAPGLDRLDPDRAGENM